MTEHGSVPHPRGYGNNARVLGHYVRGLKLITLEDAIRKMTSLPAQTFGFADRGLVREGFAADLVIFDEKTIADKATYENPHQFPVGISYVLVNGQLVLAHDKLGDARPGMSLYGQGIRAQSLKGMPVKLASFNCCFVFVSRLGQLELIKTRRISSLATLSCWKEG